MSRAIRGNFIICGKPVFEDYVIVDWEPSFVRLDTIKTVHEKRIGFIEGEEKKCIFFTYKDEWYIVSEIMITELIETINEYLDNIKKEIV